VVHRRPSSAAQFAVISRFAKPMSSAESRNCNVSISEDMRGKLIVFEGPDAVGKSTLVQYLKTLLEQDRLPNEILSFPGDRPGTIGKLVYDLHREPGKFGIEQISPIGLQALHIASHLDAIIHTILPAINCGTWIVLDRFWWSTWVYGRAAGIEPRILDSLISPEKLLWGQFTPSVVFLVQRTKPFGDKPAGDEFALLSNFYCELLSSEAANYDIITMTDVEPDAARGIIREWVRKSRDTCV
jgi:dTMP kinase